MPDVARLMLMTPRGEGVLPGKDVLLASLGANPRSNPNPNPILTLTGGRTCFSRG